MALKNGLIYKKLSSVQIRGGIEEVIVKLLNKDLDKAFKLGILKNKILESQDVRILSAESFQEIVRFIDENILPYINDKSTMGQDILNLFFTTFNKYVGKADKNQAFTPDHIVHFMCQVLGINRHSRVLDPCCGSGAFLVRAMTEAMDDCSNEIEQNEIKKKSIFGIEFEETAFGLAATNMLIHGDGNSNIRQGSCFELKSFIEDEHINTILMNPPYNAQRKHCLPEYVRNWDTNTNQDPSKGFHFVAYAASSVKTGKLAVLLPMQCAISNSRDIIEFKEKMLNEHTLDAVFSLPNEVFYPGASASVCCMVFNLGIRHDKSTKDTFFGYYKNDGFEKRKNLGRVEKTKVNSNEGMWPDIEARWLSLYHSRKSLPGLSVVVKVGAKDEWCAEAYIETNIDDISDITFNAQIKNYLINLFQVSIIPTIHENSLNSKKPVSFSETNFKLISLINHFDMKAGKYYPNDSFEKGNCPLVSASNINQGIKDWTDLDPRFDGNCITIGKVGCSAFYHPYPFCATSDVTILIPKFKMNSFVGIFLSVLINQEKFKWSYGRQIRLNDSEKLQIKLPVDSNGNPDWKFMEDYIKSLPYSSNL